MTRRLLFAIIQLTIFTSLLLFLIPQPISAYYCCDDPCNWNCYPSTCQGKDSWSTTDMSNCQAVIGNPPGANYCDTNNWIFNFYTCETKMNVLYPGCDYQYTYKQNQCNVNDRCYGASYGGTGYDEPGRVSSGICDAGRYNGSDPNSACVTGGIYKQCCSSGGVYPTTYCQNGGCPAGQITSPGVTWCQTPQSTPPPPPPPPPPGGACQCTYPETCTIPGDGGGTRVCNGIWSGPNCVWDSSGNCSPNCTTCSSNPPPPNPTNPPPPAPNCTVNPGISCNSDVNLSVTPNPAILNSSMSFQVISGDASTCYNNSWSGGVTGCNSQPWNSTCTAQTAGNNYIWTHYWQKCEGSLNNCSSLCSKTANYTIIGPTPSPTPHPPTAYFDMNTKPDKGNIGQRLDYFAWANDTGIDLIKVGIYVAPHGTQNWNTIGWAPSIECPTPNNNPLLSFYCSATYFPQQTGLFDVVVNAYDKAGTPCTGNPVCAPPTPDPALCAGWAYCGTGSNVVLNVISAIRPWIQAVGDVHSNGRINAPGGP